MIRGRLLAISLFAATIALVVVGTLWPVPAAVVYAGGTQLVRSSATPEETMANLGDDLRSHAWQKAYDSLANKAQFSEPQFEADLVGRYPGLLTYTQIDKFDFQPLHATGNDAEFRVKLSWATVVGPVASVRDVRVVRDGDRWRVEWPIQSQPALPPQVIPVTFLRWDIVTRGNDDDWGAQNVDAPRVRIISMNAVPHDGGTTILGEIVNEDTVPGFVAVEASLVGNDGKTIGEESSFDKVSHVLLPKEVSPFRIDFPNVKMSSVKNVRMQPTSLLVPASADPTIGVLNQRLDTDQNGRKVLRGELVNESGQTVNIPHVLATFYDNSGKVIWVSDGYVDHALLPQTPQSFTLGLSPEIADKVQTYRVTVNTYSINRHQES